MGCYLELKRDGLSSHENTQRKIKCVLLSEGSQAKKATYSMIQLMTLWKRQNCGDSLKDQG